MIYCHEQSATKAIQEEEGDDVDDDDESSERRIIKQGLGKNSPFDSRDKSTRKGRNN